MREQREERKEKGECIRYGKIGHRARKQEKQNAVESKNKNIPQKERKKSRRGGKRGVRRSYVDLVHGLTKKIENEEIQREIGKRELEWIEKETAAEAQNRAKDPNSRTGSLSMMHQ